MLVVLLFVTIVPAVALPNSLQGMTWELASDLVFPVHESTATGIGLQFVTLFSVQLIFSALIRT